MKRDLRNITNNISPARGSQSTSIYRANDENNKKSELSQINFLLISNYLINECTKKYHEEYALLKIPYSYIDFYFYQVSRYHRQFNDYLELFFKRLENYNKDRLISVYVRTFSKVAHSENLRDAGLHLIMKKRGFPINVSFDTGEDKELNQSFVILKSIVEAIYHNEEERSLKAQYLDFLKEITSTKDTSSANSFRTLIPIKNTPAEKSRKTTVSRFVIPKFRLPHPYPVSFVKSRVDSYYIVSGFVGSIRMLEILENYKITGVKLNADFIAKRNELLKIRQKKYKDFF